MTRTVPETPTEAMLEAGVRLALQCKIHADYTWPDYIADVYTDMIQAAPEMGGQISSISTGMAIEAQARKALLEELIKRATCEAERAHEIGARADGDDMAYVTSWLRSVLEEE